MRYPLPRDTVATLQTHIRQCRNVGLRYDKFLTVEDTSWELTRDESKKRAAAASMMNQADMRQLISRCRQRQEAIRQSYKAKGYEVSELPAALDYRLVVGFGAEHVLETNLCLHRIYSFPIIPGSAVKGVTRAWALLGENLTEDNDLFIRVFGNTERQGQVIFFDAYPSDSRKLKLQLDILNPHYGPYYSDSQKLTPPADYYNPVPTYFLTVVRGSEFQFAVASKDPCLAQKAEEWLKKALTDLGIGSKTAAGYGFMEVR